MEIRGAIEISKPLDEVWDLLANRFCEVHLWRSDVERSHMVGKTKLLNLTYAGRVLETGSGRVEEILSAYDAMQRMLSYRTNEGLPFYLRKVSTLWSVSRTTEGDTHITVIQNLKGVFPFRFLLWLKQSTFREKLKRQLEDLKRYLER